MAHKAQGNSYVDGLIIEDILKDITQQPDEEIKGYSSEGVSVELLPMWDQSSLLTCMCSLTWELSESHNLDFDGSFIIQSSLINNLQSLSQRTVVGLKLWHLTLAWSFW